MTKISNTCINTSSWPTAGKRGEWTKGDKSDVKNHRPITVLDSAGKAFEQLTTNQIVQHYDPAKALFPL